MRQISFLSDYIPGHPELILIIFLGHATFQKNNPPLYFKASSFQTKDPPHFGTSPSALQAQKNKKSDQNQNRIRKKN